MKRNVYNLLSIISGLLILLWVYASLSKLVEYNVFEQQLARQPLPHWSIPVLKWGLPIVEIAIAILLYFEKTRFKGLLISAGLMTIFTIYVAIALSGAFGEIPCSCAGIISKLHWKGHLIFNIIFTAISLLGIYKYKNSNKHNVRFNPHIP